LSLSIINPLTEVDKVTEWPLATLINDSMQSNVTFNDEDMPGKLFGNLSHTKRVSNSATSTLQQEVKSANINGCRGKELMWCVCVCIQ
jgi:hypothetical protein